MRILVIGDSHGNTYYVNKMITRAVELNCEAVVQVGDFGYWEHSQTGVEFLDNVEYSLRDVGLPLYFVDGNHENHPMLRSKYKANEDGFVPVRDNLFYIPRGHKWTWNGTTFMGVGGAHSIDRQYRLELESDLVDQVARYDANGWDVRQSVRASAEMLKRGEHIAWWPEEKITPEELDFVKSQGTADVLFTHDCPTNAPFLHRLKEDPESHAHRQTMDEIGRSVQSKIWFHGHMHESYDYEFYLPGGSSTHVIGLAHEGNAGSYYLLDTAHLDPS